MVIKAGPRLKKQNILKKRAADRTVSLQKPYVEAPFGGRKESRLNDVMRVGAPSHRVSVLETPELLSAHACSRPCGNTARSRPSERQDGSVHQEPNWPVP